MVGREVIDNILTEVLKEYSSLTVKCKPTLAEMRATLDNMDSLEKMEILFDAENDYKNPLLNPLEVEDYGNLSNNIEDVERKYKVTGEEYYLDLYNRMSDEIFQYERRIIEGAKPRNEPPVVDTSKFKYDELSDEDAWIKNGEMETAQINHQQSTLNYGEKVDEYIEDLLGSEGISYHYETYDDPRLVAMNNYFNGDCSGINYGISHKGYLSALDNEQRKEMKDIDSLMKM